MLAAAPALPSALMQEEKIFLPAGEHRPTPLHLFSHMVRVIPRRRRSSIGTRSASKRLLNVRTSRVHAARNEFVFLKGKEASMLKTLMVTTAISGLMIGAAAAQSSQPSGSQSMPSAQDKPATSAPAGNAQFINSQSADQWLSSNFIGTDVVGPDNEKIGDVNDVLFTKDGKIVAYVVGVGGFLGIGSKNVALAPTSFQMMPAGSGTTGSAAGASDDVKLKLNMTKDQLKQAASFETKKDQDSKARATSPSSSPGKPAGSPSK